MDLFGAAFPLGRVADTFEGATVANVEEVQDQLAAANDDATEIRVWYVASPGARLVRRYLDWMTSPPDPGGDSASEQSQDPHDEVPVS